MSITPANWNAAVRMVVPNKAPRICVSTRRQVFNCNQHSKNNLSFLCPNFYRIMGIQLSFLVVYHNLDPEMACLIDVARMAFGSITVIKECDPFTMYQFISIRWMKLCIGAHFTKLWKIWLNQPASKPLVCHEFELTQYVPSLYIALALLNEPSIATHPMGHRLFQTTGQGALKDELWKSSPWFSKFWLLQYLWKPTQERLRA